MTFTAPPVVLEHGERYGQLTVLERVKTKAKGTRHRVGCACGYSKTLTTAGALMSGRMTCCAKCRAA